VEKNFFRCTKNASSITQTPRRTSRDSRSSNQSEFIERLVCVASESGTRAKPTSKLLLAEYAVFPLKNWRKEVPLVISKSAI